MIKAIIFDYFGVISSYDGWNIPPVEDVLPEATFQDDLVEAWWRYCYEIAQQKGIKPSEVDADHQQHSINRRLVAYIFMLKQNYKIGLLSNLNRSYARPVIEETGMATLFDALVVSSEISHAKPHPEAYQYALGQLKVLPNETIFVDDGLRNVQGANEVGMYGIHYEDFVSTHREIEASLSNPTNGV